MTTGTVRRLCYRPGDVNTKGDNPSEKWVHLSPKWGIEQGQKRVYSEGVNPERTGETNLNIHGVGGESARSRRKVRNKRKYRN